MKTKIKSNLKENYWKIYNEAKYIAMHKTKIIKKGKVKKANYFEEVVLIYAILMMLASAIILIKNISNIYAYILIIIAFIYIIIINIKAYEEYTFRKEKKYESTILISKKGITDPSSFSEIDQTLKWEMIKAVVLSNHSVIILTDRKDYFYFDIKEKNKVVKEIKKHKKDIQIIEN